MDDEHKEEFYDELADQLENDTGWPYVIMREMIEALYEKGYCIVHADEIEP